MKQLQIRFPCKTAVRAPGLKPALLVLLMFAGTCLSASAKPDDGQTKLFKRMMLALQVITETYAVDHDTYATTLAELKREAQAGDYWVDQVHYTERAPGGPEVDVRVVPEPVLYLDAVSTGEVTGVTTLPAQLPVGVIYYRAMGEARQREYCIFALDGKGALLKDDQGRDYYLSSRDDASLCRLP